MRCTLSEILLEFVVQFKTLVEFLYIYSCVLTTVCPSVTQIYNLVGYVGALAGRPIIMQRGVDLSEDPGISPPVRVA